MRTQVERLNQRKRIQQPVSRRVSVSSRTAERNIQQAARGDRTTRHQRELSGLLEFCRDGRLREEAGRRLSVSLDLLSLQRASSLAVREGSTLYLKHRPPKAQYRASMRSGEIREMGFGDRR